GAGRDPGPHPRTFSWAEAGPGAAGLRLRAAGGGGARGLRRRAPRRRRGSQRGCGRGEPLPGLLRGARAAEPSGAHPRRRDDARRSRPAPRAARSRGDSLGLRPWTGAAPSRPGAGARAGAAVHAGAPGGGAMTTVAGPLRVRSEVRFTPARATLVLGGLLLLALAALAASALLGEYPVHLSRALADRASPDGRVLFGLRIPRAVLGALVGASLAASGSALQALLRNPLADPFVLGVSGGAALGATLALALGLQ